MKHSSSYVLSESPISVLCVMTFTLDLLNTDLKNTSTSKVLVKPEFRPKLNPCKNSGRSKHREVEDR